MREPDGTLRQYGAVPPKGAVIRARRYRTGGGRAGNVARGAVQVLRNSVPYVSEVVNREAARGGVDGETVDEAKVRAPITLRAQDRAVTLRDYEELARRAAPETARITCLEGDPDEHGAYAVRVLVVPQAVPDPGGRLRFEQLVPGDALLGRITRYLDERRLIGTRLAVGPPFYQGVTVVATVHAFRGADTDRVRRQAHDALYRHLDPLTGGADGKGWPFGRPVQSGEIFAVLQRVPGRRTGRPGAAAPGRPADRQARRARPTGSTSTRPALVFSFDHRVRVIGDGVMRGSDRRPGLLRAAGRDAARGLRRRRPRAALRRRARRGARAPSTTCWTASTPTSPRRSPRRLHPLAGGWVGAETDGTEDRRRRLRAAVAAAAYLHRIRGTRRGLAEAVRLAFGVEPEITESGGAAWNARPLGPFPGDRRPRLHVTLAPARPGPRRTSTGWTPSWPPPAPPTCRTRSR